MRPMRTVESPKQKVYHVHTMAKKQASPKPAPNPWPARLRALRERLALTQAAAAQKVRISRRAWVKWEMGDQIPSPAHQLLIELLEQEKI